MQEVWKRVFSNWRYSLLATLVSVLVFSASVFVSNISLISAVVDSSASLVTKTFFLLSLYGTIGTNFSIISAITTVLISVLVGVNVSLLLFYIQTRKISGKNRVGHSAGFLGLISGLFGIGCAACGSVILTGLVSSVGGLALLAVLPLHGAEFSLLGLALLSYSIYELTKRIADPLVCPIV